MRKLGFLVRLVVLFQVLGIEAQAGPAYAVHRIGSFSTPGELLCFDTADPGAGRLMGNIGLGNVGTMDFLGDELWVVSGDDNVMTFYTLDLETATPLFRSAFDGPFGGTSVFSGSFDSNGFYWVVDFIFDVIRKMDPRTGESLATVPISSGVGFNGVAFVGDTLYAVQGATFDPPQLFGIINTQTGQFETIGRTFVGVGGNGGGNGTGVLDYDPVTGTMYLVYRSGIEPGQLWSLYTVNLATGMATFVGEIQPERNIDACAVAPPSLGLARNLETLVDLVDCLEGPQTPATFESCVALDSELMGDSYVDLRDVAAFLNQLQERGGCGAAGEP